MLTKLEETACRMEGYRCLIVSKIYVTLQGHTRGQLNLRKIKKILPNTSDLGKKNTTQGDHCNWLEKICSSRYHDGNIFKNIHGPQKKSH